MRIPCPTCGIRDLREFTYQGDAIALDRPERDAGHAAWNGYLHERKNPAGSTVDLWYHDPCGTWAVVHRNTVTHEVFKAQHARQAGA